MGIGYTQVLNKGISFVTATPVHTPGDRVLFGGDEYIYMYNRGGTMTAKAGYPVYMSVNTGYSFTAGSFTTDVDSVAGIVKHVDIPIAEYGWVLARGWVDVYAGLNTGLAVGDKLIGVSTTNTGGISRKTLHTAYSQMAGEPIPFGECCQAAATGAAGACRIWGAW